MSDAVRRQSGLPHAVFLRRLASAPSAIAADARLSQGAFLVLRLVDLLADPRPLYADAFHYQHAASERFCRDLPADSVETAHLVGLVRSAADAYQTNDVRLVLPALLAYAHHLEDALRLDEALDVLCTLLSVGGGRLGPSDRVAAQLRIGRVNRKLNRFDDADAAYNVAAELADITGDVYSALLSRVGRAIATQAKGNLAESERLSTIGRMISTIGHEDEMRLSCQCAVKGDCTVETIPGLQLSPEPDAKGKQFSETPWPNK